MLKRITKQILKEKLSNPKTVYKFLKGLNGIQGDIHFKSKAGLHKIMIWYPKDLSWYQHMKEDKKLLEEFSIGEYTIFRIGGNGYSTALTVFVDIKLK